MNNFYKWMTEKEIKKLWLEYIDHPFIIKLLNNNEKMIDYKNYLVQDKIFLKKISYVILENIFESNHSKEFINLMKNNLFSVIEYEIKDREIEKNYSNHNVIDDVTYQYIKYIEEVSKNNNNLIVFALAPCPLGYLEGVTKNITNHISKIINKWTNIYSLNKNQANRKLYYEWISYLNSKYQILSENEARKARDIFTRVVKYEIIFFNHFVKGAIEK